MKWTYAQVFFAPFSADCTLRANYCRSAQLGLLIWSKNCGEKAMPSFLAGS